jgi:tRNA A-37 threonylcarbamoyl transferase component Bud32
MHPGIPGPGSATPRRTHATAFRVAPDASSPVRSNDELERRLRRRLRLLASLLAAFTGALALSTIVIRRQAIAAELSMLWTEPPLPGVLLVLSLLAIGLVVILAPRFRPGLGRLRVIEWAGVAMTAAFFVMNQARALPPMLTDFVTKPMEIGVAQGAPWGVLIVAYGVLVPSSFRHSVIRTAVIAACAFLPELILIPGSDAALIGLAPYLVLKTLIIAVMSALALYGSYRIESLNQDVEVARELGQYLLRRSLGEGGMGSVYLAEHRFLRRPCAVKLIRAEQANDEVALARFEREVQSAAALTHPNTVQVYDYGRSEDGTFYFAMEFLPGISLDDLVTQHGPLEPARVVHILRQLCGALHEAHARGLVHRDLKPGNVMLCERGAVPDVAKLLDFGLVAPVELDQADPRITQAGMIMGTPAFMSPEQCLGEAVTPSSDIYSLGALGYFLLTGAAPFSGRSAMVTLMSHVNDVPQRVSDIRPTVPRELSDVIARCLEKQTAARYPDALAVEQALADALGGAGWTTQDARTWWRNSNPSLAAHSG